MRESSRPGGCLGMNTAHGLDDALNGADHAVPTREDGGVGDAMFDLGGDERRMHVRAYNHWVSMLRGRPYPSIADLDPANIADFGANSVLLDFTADVADPSIAFLGRALREESGLDGSITHVSGVPSRSLLSRLTDHYLQIIANRAPIGFEAEFVSSRGHTTLYRGILMPFSSDGAVIDFIYGVINWKEMVDDATQAGLAAELDAVVRPATPVPAAPVWADGPSASLDVGSSGEASGPAVADSLEGRLEVARESAAAARSAESRSRAALYRALGRAHDFGLAAESDSVAYDALLAMAGIAVQARAPMTPVVKLVFGIDYDKARLTEFAAVLQHARRHAIGFGGLSAFLESFDGGLKAIVAAERDVRRPVDEREAPVPVADRAPIAHVALDTGAAPGSVVILVARVSDDGGLDVVGTVADDAALAERALRAAR